MKFSRLVRALATFIFATLLAACGGGGGSGPAPVPPPPVVAPPQYPIPAGMWSAPAGTAPASGNYVYLQSDQGDYIGAGATRLYTTATTQTSITNAGLAFSVQIEGAQNWQADFLLPAAAGTLQTGYFANLKRVASADKATGGLDWNGEGRGCNTLTGWLIVDKLTLVNGALDAIDFRFEQHCEGASPALRGQVRWTRQDAATRPTPVPQQIPAGLWQPAAGALPAGGNYMYLQSGADDSIGLGGTYLYTPSDAVLTVGAQGLNLSVLVAGDEDWSGNFRALRGMPRLAVGYYAKTEAGDNPLLSDLNWGGEGRGCGTTSSWFAIDKISFNGDNVSAVDLRFEMTCQGSSAPLRGKLHWTADTTATPPGPQNPPPAGLWKPASSFVPPAGNYVYLVNGRDNQPELATPANTTIQVETTLKAAMRIAVGGSAGWTGEFFGMNSLSQLVPGYYGDLQRYPFHNPAKGGMDWYGYGRGCNEVKGWFVVDQVSYEAGQLKSIDLRFEHYCDVDTQPRNGVIHWAR